MSYVSSLCLKIETLRDIYVRFDYSEKKLFTQKFGHWSFLGMCMTKIIIKVCFTRILHSANEFFIKHFFAFCQPNNLVHSLNPYTFYMYMCVCNTYTYHIYCVVYSSMCVKYNHFTRLINFQPKKSLSVYDVVKKVKNP